MHFIHSPEAPATAGQSVHSNPAAPGCIGCTGYTADAFGVHALRKAAACPGSFKLRTVNFWLRLSTAYTASAAATGLVQQFKSTAALLGAQQRHLSSASCTQLRHLFLGTKALSTWLKGVDL